MIPLRTRGDTAGLTWIALDDLITWLREAVTQEEDPESAGAQLLEILAHIAVRV